MSPEVTDTRGPSPSQDSLFFPSLVLVSDIYAEETGDPRGDTRPMGANSAGYVV